MNAYIFTMSKTMQYTKAKLSIVYVSLWFVFVFALCSFPGNQIPNFEFLNQISFDKIIHLGMFAVQMVLVQRALYLNNFSINIYIIPIAELLIVWGITLEYMQTVFFINRFGEWVDAIANSLGVIIGGFIAHKLYTK